MGHGLGAAVSQGGGDPPAELAQRAGKEQAAVAGQQERWVQEDQVQ